MSIRRILGLTGLLALTSVSFGQTQTRFLQLAKDPPKEMLLATPRGLKPATDILHLSISLKPRDVNAFESFADSVSDPKSPNYRNFISPEEVGARFGLTDTEVSQVTNYLSSNGMQVKLVAKNHLSILFDATVAQAQNAFHTNFHQFSVFGSKPGTLETKYSFTSRPELPSQFALKVDNIGGLENFNHKLARTPLTPTQLRGVYKVASIYASGNKGQDRTIAISNFDGFRVENVATLCTQYGLPTPAAGAGTNVTVKPVSGGSGAGTQSGEGDLDIQTALSIAPLCNLIVYDGGNDDMIGVLTLEANDNIADIISESYGWRLDSQTSTAAHNLHLAMTSQGITYMSASGDTGTSFQGYVYPGNDPEVLSVGGTSVVVDANNNRVTEVGWNSNGGAGGGGWSPTNEAFNKHPAYQVGKGVPSATKVPYRLIPDLALDADPDTGYVIFDSGMPYQFGGTSGASPTFAGALAAAEQYLISSGFLSADSKGHYRLGRIQDLIYSWNGDPSVFYDVTSGTNGTLPDQTTSNAGIGWDTDTGWGAMNFAGFIAKLSSGAGIKSLVISPSTVEGGSTAVITGTITLSSAAGFSGTTVTLSSSSSSVTVPASVIVGSGKTVATFKVTAKTVGQLLNATITATSGGESVSAALTVTPPVPTAVTIAPATAIGGSTTKVTGTVKLDKVAPAGGVSVTLLSDAPLAGSVPETVTVAAGASTATFTVSTHGVSASTTVHISANTGGAPKSGTLTVTPAVLASMTVDATSGHSGDTVTGHITLTGQAGGSGAMVSISVSSSQYATVTPAIVIVPVGTSTGTFSVLLKNIDAAKSLVVTAKLGTVSKTATIKLLPPGVATVTSSISTGLGGVDKSTITVTLTGPAGAAGAKVALLVSPAAAAKFAATSVTIPSGSKSGTAVLTLNPVTADTTVTVTATLNGSAKATLVDKAAVLTNFALSAQTVKGGLATVIGTVTLSGPAGPGARTITLASSNKTFVTVPATVAVVANKTVATFVVGTKKVTASTDVTLTAKLGTVSLTTGLTVTP